MYTNTPQEEALNASYEAFEKAPKTHTGLNRYPLCPSVPSLNSSSKGIALSLMANFSYKNWMRYE